MARTLALIVSLTAAKCFAADSVRTILGNLSLQGNVVFGSDDLYKSLDLKTGVTYDPRTVESAIQRIITHYADNGYPFVKAEIIDAAMHNDTIDIAIVIHEGTRARIGECLVEGLVSTDTSVVAREILRAQYYSRSEVAEALMRLQRLGIFREISEPIIEPLDANSIRLRIRVVEGHTTTADGIISYGSDGDGGSQVAGFAQLAFANIGGTARKASFIYKRESKTTDDLQLHYTEPWVFGEPVSGSLSFAQASEDSTYTRTSFSLGAEFSVSHSTAIRLNGGYQAYEPGKAGIMYKTSQITTGIDVMYNDIVNPLNQTSGLILTLGALYTSKRLAGSVAVDSANDAAAAISSFTLHAEQYMQTFSERLVLALKSDIFVIGSGGRIQYADLHHIGGLTTLRGYFESEFHTSRYVIGTVEYRLLFADASYTALFADMGYLRRQRTIGMTDESMTAFGWGIALALGTRIGVLKAAVALPKGESIDRAKLHFGITTSF